MKKFFMFITIAMFSVNVANAQLSDLVNKVTSAYSSAKNNGTTSSSNSSSNVLSTLGNIISSKLVPTTSQIVGTWTYQKPAVMFTSNNALTSAAASLGTSSIENKLQTYLDKAGIKKGKVSITFNEDKSFSVNWNSKKVASGTYTISGNDVSLTFKGRKNPCKLTPQLNNGTLCIVGDATKLKTFFESMGNKSSALSSLTSLTKNMQGLKLGMRLSK